MRIPTVYDKCSCQKNEKLLETAPEATRGHLGMLSRNTSAFAGYTPRLVSLIRTRLHELFRSQGHCRKSVRCLADW